MYFPEKRILTALSFLCCIFPALIACGPGSMETKKPAAHMGIIDLRGWDFKRDGSINLNGEWEFCWNSLREPSDFTEKGDRKDCGFIRVPGLWKSHMINGVRLPGKGRAAYRLKIMNVLDKSVKTLTIHRIYSSYKLWINGVLVDKKGIANAPLKTREDYIYIHNKRLSSFIPVEGVNEIILHVFNNDYESGGIDRSLRLEDGEVSAGKEFQKYTINMIIVGLLLFASVYNILFYFFRKRDKTPLYIGFASLVWATNTYNIESPILSGAFSYPGNPFLINYITVILGMILALMIIKSLFPDDFSTYILRFSQITAIGLIVSLFFVGFRTSKIIMSVHFIFCILYVMYSMYVFIQTIKNRREDAVLFFIGFIPLFIGGINNILYAMLIINTGNVIHYGMVVLCFTSTIVISRRFSRTHRMVEELSKDLEEKNLSLIKIDQLKDQFLANMSHELRTPLHGMIGLSESMIEGAVGSLSPKALDNLSLIASSGQRLASMVNDLLDMARIQDKGLSLALRPVNIYTLCEMVVKLSLPLAGGKPIEIINSIEPDIPAVYADEDRIRQVLHNLIGNAIKFTNKGRIEISSRVISTADGYSDADPGKMIEVSVSDTGIGVPEDYKETIFEAYHQVDGSDTRSYGGTGLGLAIAKQIIEMHNGTISVAPGESGGSVFSFTLPVTDDRVPDSQDELIIESIHDALPTDDNRYRLQAGTSEVFDNNPVILVVDDDPVNVRVIQNYFESKGCVVKTAADGISAIEIIDRDESIDLVLLDIMMPVMSGYDVCRRIRVSKPAADLPVIMLTAKNMMADIDAAFEAGANDYIVKPFRISELLGRVSTMLKLRNIRKSAAEGITVRARGRAYSLKFSEIIYITSQLKNIIIHTAERDIELPVQMKEIIHRLPPDMYVRIHKSHIINIRYVHTVSHVQSGRYKVRLRDPDETELPVGRAFLGSLRKKM